MSSERRPALPTGKLVQFIAMDAAVVLAGIWLFLQTDEIGWIVAALIGSGAISWFMLVKPLMDAGKRGDPHVD